MSEESNGSLYGKIISRDGVLGLIAFMAVTFLMSVIYMGQKDMAEVHRHIISEQQEQTQVLRDIRYALRVKEGLTLRNTEPAD